MQSPFDWEKAQGRYIAWLAGQNDTPLVQIKAPLPVAQTHGYTGWNFVHDTAHPEKGFDAYERYCRQTHFAGDSMPILFINLGPGTPAAYLGCHVDIRPDTVWFEDAHMSWEQILATRLDEHQRWWKYTLDIYRMAGEMAASKYIVGATDINAVMNILGSLRGTQHLLMDLIEEPQQVQRCIEHIQPIWQTCYDRIYDITQTFQKGLANWMNVWGPGRFCDVQCDFSALIGPGMFKEFVLDHIAQECRSLDWSIFHLDGPGQISHLDMLLDIPELTGIQWVPGAGKPGTGSPKWFDMYKKIQAHGKRLILQGMAKADAQYVCETLNPAGLLIEIVQIPTPKEADDLARSVPAWSGK